jgi:DinB superfamily
MTTETAATTLADAAATADSALERLETVLGRISDGDLHLAHPDGGWTPAQLVSHIGLSTLVWLGDMERLRQDAKLELFYREEIGHDAVGYPPPTTELARGRLASTRWTIRTCLPNTDPAILDRTVEIPDLGTMTVLEWIPIIVGHVTMHAEQALDVLRSRAAFPEGA